MGFFKNFPYTNYHDLNLDFILKQMVDLQNEFSNYQALNYVSYGGVWDISKNYKKWTIVTQGNASYISIVPVPPNVDIKDSEYWLKAADLDPRYEQIIEDIANIHSDIENIDARIEATELDITTISAEIKKLPKKSIFMSSFADPTGVKDCSEDVKKISGNITLIVDSGNYRIDGDITIGDNINVIFVGGVIKCSGTLTIKNLTAGKYRIVDADKCVFGNGSMIGYPEWFGGKADGETESSAAINTAIKTLGKIILSNGIYLCNSEIFIDRAIYIEGSGMWNNTKKYTLLKFAGNYGIRIEGANASLEGVKISNITIQTNGGSGISVIGANRAIFEDIFVYNANYGFSISRCVGCYFTRCNVYADFVGESIGFQLYKADYANWPFVGDNASLFIQNCRYIGLAQNINNAIGISGYNSNADIFIENFEASQVNHGIILDGSNSVANTNPDITIVGAVIDLYKTSGITVRNMQPTSCIIDRCYLAPAQQTEVYSNGVHIDGSFGVTVSNCNIWGGYLTMNTDKWRGIMLTFAKNVVMSGNIITNFSTGILIFGLCEFIKSMNTIVKGEKGGDALVFINSGANSARCCLSMDSAKDSNISINGSSLFKVCIDTCVKDNCNILYNGQVITETTDGVIVR